MKPPRSSTGKGQGTGERPAQGPRRRGEAGGSTGQGAGKRRENDAAPDAGQPAGTGVRAAHGEGDARPATANEGHAKPARKASGQTGAVQGSFEGFEPSAGNKVASTRSAKPVGAGEGTGTPRNASTPTGTPTAKSIRTGSPAAKGTGGATDTGRAAKRSGVTSPSGTSDAPGGDAPDEARTASPAGSAGARGTGTIVRGATGSGEAAREAAPKAAPKAQPKPARPFVAGRLLAPSRILRETPRQIGGGREREELVEEARRSIAKGSKSFAAASRLFDRDTRERAWMLYAWCRRCDDIADGQDHGGPLRAGSRDRRHDPITGIRVLTARALDGQPTADPSFDALGQVAQEAGLAPELIDDLVEGFALDAAGWRPRTEQDLMRYCYHVAGAVGVMMARIMGVAAEEDEVLDRACDMGFAFQLNNIARDLSEDDAAGRCYLPVEWLVEADIPPGQHMKPAYRDQLMPLVTRLLDLAEEHEAAARAGAARLAFRQRWAVLAAANIYGAIGREVRLRGPRALDRRVRIGALAKLRHIAAALREALRSPTPPASLPHWTRGQILIAVRMAGPIAPNPTTPLPDEEVR